MLGFAEQLELIATLRNDDLEPLGGRAAIASCMLDAARATCDFYIDSASGADGIPYWDTGASGLDALGDLALKKQQSVQRPRTGRQFRCRNACSGSPPARQRPRGQ